MSISTRFLLLLATCGVWWYACPTWADIIYLKSGRQIECIRAWEEGKEVKYTITGGTVGIPKSLVAKIVKTDPPASKPSPSKPESETVDSGSSKQNESPLPDAQKLKLAKYHTDTGMSYIEKKDYPGALEEFQKAHRLLKNEETNLNLAVTYYALQDEFNAESYFHEVLRFNPRNVDALNLLGQISWMKEDLASAQSYWSRSLEIKKDPEIQSRLSKLKKEKNISSDYENTKSRHFIIRYDEGEANSRLVQEISEFLEDVYRDLSTLYETYPIEPFVVVLYPRQEFYKVMDVPLWSAGANDGKIKMPIKGLDSINQDFRETLTHELSHSFVGWKTSGNCPVWLNEGLAQYSEGKRASEDGKKVLATLVQNKQLPSFHQIQGSFAEFNSEVATILYLQSLAFVEYLADTYPFYQMNEVLDRLGQGTTFDRAFEAAYITSFSETESKWTTQLTETYASMDDTEAN